jgi:gluconokinase
MKTRRVSLVVRVQGERTAPSWTPGLAMARVVKLQSRFFCGVRRHFDWPAPNPNASTMTSDESENPENPQSGKPIPLFIVGGPTGCGKSTIAQAIATKFHFPFIEGDSLHPASNIAKMSSGTPLVDADRWDWLDCIISTSQQEEREKRPSGVVITCSSLKRSYRDRMRERVREGREKGSSLREYFIFCDLSQEESFRRANERPGHFMKAQMVASQFADLQVPDPKEEERVYVVDVERSIPEIEADAIQYVKRVLAGDNA